ncbi:MAG: WG repeat-containing protein [Cyclobacteriaceae bacterium]|nr:WG repeat-containing protein [Cyclobacteriaceae bacterium]
MKRVRAVFLTILFISTIHIQGTALAPLGYEIFEEGNKKGLKDEEGNILIHPDFDDLGWSRGDFVVIKNVLGYRINGKWGLISTSGNKITEEEFVELYPSEGQLYFIASKVNSLSQRTLFGLVDKKGHTRFPFQYARLEIYENQVITYNYTSQNILSVGLRSLDDEEIIPTQYRSIYPLGTLRYIVEDINGKKILFNDQGKPVAEYEFDSVSIFDRGYAKVFLKHKTGLINREGKLIVEPKYQDVKVLQDKTIQAKPLNKWFLLNPDKKVINTFEYENIEKEQDSLYKVSTSGHTWLINDKKESITNEEYTYLGEFINKIAIYKKDKRFGIVSLAGDVIIPNRFDTIYRENRYFIAGTGKQSWVIFDEYGVKKTPSPYEAIGTYDGKYFPVKRYGHWGFISREGKEVIHCIYDSPGVFTGNLGIVNFKGHEGIINREGHWIVTPVPNQLEVIDDSLYIEKKSNQTLVKKYNGELIYFTNNTLIPQDGYFIERLADSTVWRIDFRGTIASDEIKGVLENPKPNYSSFEEIYPPSEGFYGIKKDGRYGFIDDQNRLRIANRYEGIGKFSEGLARMKILGRWGYIDKKEIIVIQPTFKYATDFTHGIAIVQREEGFGIIDKTGKFIFNAVYDSLEIMGNEKIKIRENGRFGLISKEGKSILNANYDTLEDLENGYYIISKLGKYGVIDNNAVDVLPRIYHKLIYYPELNLFLGMQTSDWVEVIVEQ